MVTESKHQQTDEDIFPCPACDGRQHESKFITYEPDYEREFVCQRCGHVFYCATWGKSWQCEVAAG